MKHLPHYRCAVDYCHHSFEILLKNGVEYSTLVMIPMCYVTMYMVLVVVLVQCVDLYVTIWYSVVLNL